MNNADIVIVEDNPHDLEMILDALRESETNREAHILRDGAEAARYFFGNGDQDAGIHHPFLLILLDLKLPKINGVEVLKLLKSDERTKQIPVVVFTSSNEARDKADSYRLGANSYVVKPLDADDFADHVKQIVDYWTRLNINAC
ncbi:MAG: response regulator [Deltaproteobacteria bacterium]